MDLVDSIRSGSPIEAPVALVLAHPDDETASAGALLQRLCNPILIYLTDGAPRDLDDARREGFDDWRAYRDLRRSERRAALAGLGVRVDPLCYDEPDKQAHETVAELVGPLARDLAGAAAVITHAYEHGHPDHDTAALAVALARRRLGGAAPAAFEFAGYHLGAEEPVYGSFWGGGGIALYPTDREIERKRAALAAYRSQRETLSFFPLAPERFRAAPDYDFGQAAPPRRALYDLYGCEVTAERWRELVAEPVQ
jgi:LmbE family N-acetylglucosaminyl deacetylase